MEYGPLIKYFRTQKGLTQKDLANGICSVSHLSKIENNGKDANKETISMLLMKLDIDQSSIYQKEEEIKSLIEELNEKMKFYQKKEIDTIYAELSKLEDIIPFSRFLYKYELSKYRYLLFKGRLQEADQQESLLNKQRKNFSQHETYLFQYYFAVNLIMKGQYQKADTLLESLVTSNSNEVFGGELLYHRALVKSSLVKPDLAIHFGKKALQAFMNEHNFIRILHTLMMLGINYTYSNIYEEALDCFRHLMRNAELLSESELLPHIYHNIGFLRSQMGNSQDALFYYRKSLALQHGDTPNYLVTLYAIGETLFLNNELEEAAEIFNRVQNLSKRLSHQKYILLSRYYLKAIDSYEESLEYLENKIIPYLEENNEHHDKLCVFYKLLFSHYRKQGSYKKAVKYIEKIS